MGKARVRGGAGFLFSSCPEVARGKTCHGAGARHFRRVKIPGFSDLRTHWRRGGMALICLISLPAVRAEESGDPISLLHELDRGFAALFERVAPTVVVIEATREITEEDLDERNLELLLRDQAESPDAKSAHPPFHHRSSRSEGSGFFVGKEGYVVTNLHVIDGADELEIRTQDRRRFPAKVIGRDEQTDIAVLRIEIETPPVASFADSDAVRIGQLVGAIGAPFNQDYSFTCGWVSGTGRTNLLGPNSEKLLLEDYIQTDAFINPGNSGGPLFDVDGRVVGMNTLINGLGRGIAFAIPSNLVRDVVDQLVTTGKVRRSWLGIRMGAVEDSGALEGRLPDIDHGVVVYTIVADSPAYQSELRPHDIITAVGGRKVSLPRDLQREIFRAKVGTRLELDVWRDGKTINVPVTTDELPANARQMPLATTQGAPSRASHEIAGLTLEDAGSGKCRVAGVHAGSPAAKAELAVDDIITAVETEPVDGATAAEKALTDALEAGGEKGVLINFERAGKKSWVVIERPKE